MKRREKILGLGLLATVGTFFGADAIEATWTSLTSPIQSELTEAALNLDQLRIDLMESRDREQTLLGWKEQSLPSDPAIAGILYQELLVHFLDRSGIAKPAINVASPIPVEGAGHRLQFTVLVNATFAQLGSFLDLFESSTILHQMKQIQVQQSDGPESGQCNITMVIEALALQGADGIALDKFKLQKPAGAISRQLAASELFRKPAKVIQTSTELSIDSLLTILQPKSNEAAETTPVSSSVETMPIEAREITPSKPKLVGIIGQGESKSALVYKSSTENPIMLAERSSLDAIGMVGLVEKITPDSILVAQEKTKITIRLGEDFDF